MIHPDTELRIISPTIGYGLFAKKFITFATYNCFPYNVIANRTDFIAYRAFLVVDNLLGVKCDFDFVVLTFVCDIKLLF